MRVEVPNIWPPVEGAERQPKSKPNRSCWQLVAVNCEGGEMPTIPSIYAQTLFMGPKYDAVTTLEKLGCASKHTGESKNAFQRGSLLAIGSAWMTQTRLGQICWHFNPLQNTFTHQCAATSLEG